MHLNIFVSSKCFTYCKGCYSYSREEKINQIVDTKIIIDFLKYAYCKGLKKVTFCGGDPLTRADIINLLKQTKEIGYKINLDTVGTTIIKDAYLGNKKISQIDASKLTKYVDTISIPIDGSNNSIINTFRSINSNNNLENILKICEKLHAHGGNISINTVVHRQNIKDAEQLANLLNTLNYINEWQLFKYIPSGLYGYLNRKQFSITDNEYNTFKHTVLKNYKSKNKVIFKDENKREKLYLLVDNSGNVWIPNFANYQKENHNNRIILGNINNQNDWDSIINILSVRSININNQDNKDSFSQTKYKRLKI